MALRNRLNEDEMSISKYTYLGVDLIICQVEYLKIFSYALTFVIKE